MKEILEKVLIKMPTEFTSKKFSAQAREFGFDGAQYYISGFLKERCLPDGSNHRWIKRPNPAEIPQMSEGACIAFL